MNIQNDNSLGKLKQSSSNKWENPNDSKVCFINHLQEIMGQFTVNFVHYY